LVQELDGWLRRAQRAEAAQHLHRACERLRFLDGAATLSTREQRELSARCRAVWDTRALVADRDGAPLDHATEEQARGDLIDFAMLWGDLDRRLAPNDEGARARGEARVAEARSLCGPGGDRAREEVWLARSLLQRGELRRAAAALERASELRPGDFW